MQIETPSLSPRKRIVFNKKSQKKHQLTRSLVLLVAAVHLNLAEALRALRAARLVVLVVGDGRG